LGPFSWILADFGQVAKFLVFGAFQVPLVVNFQAFLKGFGSPSSLAIIFLYFVGVFSSFWLFLKRFAIVEVF